MAPLPDGAKGLTSAEDSAVADGSADQAVGGDAGSVLDPAEREIIRTGSASILVEDPETKRPAAALASRVVQEALGRGLLLLKAGVGQNCIRVLVPLVVTDAELDEALGVWEDALAATL